MQKKVLCKGFVDVVDHMGSDLTVCNAARVSFSKDTDWEIDTEAVERLRASGSSYHEEDVRKLGERDQKLIRYLAKHQHWTVCTSANHSANQGPDFNSHTNVQTQTGFCGKRD